MDARLDSVFRVRSRPEISLTLQTKTRARLAYNLELAMNREKRVTQNERGATLVVSALILALLTVFVAAALINTTSTSISVNNDAAAGQAFYAAYSGLEMMTKTLNDFFVNNTRLTPDQIEAIKNSKPDIPDR